MGSVLPPCPFSLRSGLRGFRHPRLSEKVAKRLRSSSLGLPSPFRGTAGCRAAASARAMHGASTAPPLRFGPLQRFSDPGSGLMDRSCLARPACVSRFSQPPDAFIRPQILPALFHAGYAHGVHPSELYSSRTAVRRLRRRYPLAVSVSPRRLRGRTESASRRSAPTFLNGTSAKPARRPATPGSCSVRESATNAGGLDRRRHVALLGIHPLQGVLPR